MTGDPRATDAEPSAWRVSGPRRWLPVLLLACFLLQALGRLYSLLVEPPPHLADWLLLVLATLGAASAAGMLVATRRTAVGLGPDGIDIRGGRRRLIPYTDVVRAHRDRFNRGAVSLDLADGSRLVLPAPVAGPKDPAPEIDEAVALIQARVAAARPPGGGGVPG